MGGDIPRNLKRFCTQTQKSTCPKTHHCLFPKCFSPRPTPPSALPNEDLKNLSFHLLPHGSLATKKGVTKFCPRCIFFPLLTPLTLLWLPTHSPPWLSPASWSGTHHAVPLTSRPVARFADPASPPPKYFEHGNRKLFVPRILKARGAAHHL